MKMPVAACCLLAALAGTVPVAAQEEHDEMVRRELIDQAGQARRTGDHEQALDLAGRAGRVRMSPSLRLMIAEESRDTGRLVPALEGAYRCAAEAQADRQTPNTERVLALCTALAQDLGRRVGRLQVDVPSSAGPGVRLLVAGREVPRNLWSMPVPVVPGLVTVEIADGRGMIVRRDVRVMAGSRVAVPIDLPAGVSRDVLRPSVGRPDGRRTGPGAGPWALVGVGGLALGSAAVLFVLADGQRSARDAVCPTAAPCTDLATASAHDSTYRDEALAGNIALGIGAAGVVGGLLWWLVAPRGSGSAPVPSVAIAPMPGGALLALQGRL
jgi:hypothetical protein